MGTHRFKNELASAYPSGVFAYGLGYLSHGSLGLGPGGSGLLHHLWVPQFQATGIAGRCEFFLLFGPAVTSFLGKSGGGVDQEDFYIKEITVVRTSLSDPNLFFKKFHWDRIHIPHNSLISSMKFNGFWYITLFSELW